MPAAGRGDLQRGPLGHRQGHAHAVGPPHEGRQDQEKIPIPFPNSPAGVPQGQKDHPRTREEEAQEQVPRQGLAEAKAVGEGGGEGVDCGHGAGIGGGGQAHPAEEDQVEEGHPKRARKRVSPRGKAWAGGGEGGEKRAGQGQSVKRNPTRDESPAWQPSRPPGSGPRGEAGGRPGDPSREAFPPLPSPGCAAGPHGCPRPGRCGRGPPPGGR